MSLESHPFRGRIAIVTGAGGVIGGAISRRLRAAGAAVCLADCVAPEELASELDDIAPGRAAACSLDVRSASSVRACFDGVTSEWGGLDILVTAAGITSLGSFQTITEEMWDEVLGINLKGVFLCDQAAIAPMKARGFGRIVNIGSILAKNGGNARPWREPEEQRGAANAAYGAAKAGVHALTLYLAKELAAWNITVNAVAPGPVRSPMTASLPAALVEQIPVGRLGAPEEVAEAVFFLCRPETAFITGEILDVNGGSWVD